MKINYYVHRYFEKYFFGITMGAKKKPQNFSGLIN